MFCLGKIQKKLQWAVDSRHSASARYVQSLASRPTAARLNNFKRPTWYKKKTSCLWIFSVHLTMAALPVVAAEHISDGSETLSAPYPTTLVIATVPVLRLGSSLLNKVLHSPEQLPLGSLHIIGFGARWKKVWTPPGFSKSIIYCTGTAEGGCYTGVGVLFIIHEGGPLADGWLILAIIVEMWFCAATWYKRRVTGGIQISAAAARPDKDDGCYDVSSRADREPLGFISGCTEKRAARRWRPLFKKRRYGRYGDDLYLDCIMDSSHWN